MKKQKEIKSKIGAVDRANTIFAVILLVVEIGGITIAYLLAHY